MGRGRGEKRGKGRHDSGEENMFCLPVLQEGHSSMRRGYTVRRGIISIQNRGAKGSFKIPMWIDRKKKRCRRLSTSASLGIWMTMPDRRGAMTVLIGDDGRRGFALLQFSLFSSIFLYFNYITLLTIQIGGCKVFQQLTR